MDSGGQSVGNRQVAVGRARESSQSSTRTTLELLGTFALRIEGDAVALARGSERLLGFLALHKPTDRRVVAGALWPDIPDERASANLRAATWRLPGQGRGIILAKGGKLALDAAVDCDARRLERSAWEVLRSPEQLVPVGELCRLADDLLPAWDEEWLVLEREWLRQLRMQTLDLLCERLIQARRPGEAVLVAMAAVRGDPLRESSQRLLVEAHESNHNRGQAVRQYDSFRVLLRRELGMDPAFPRPGSSAVRDLTMTAE